ncbi:MAG: hypothetical protein JKY26_17430 [Pseudomonas sp.]|nr:hypothetical protein [Pseudomonas sp.]
MRSLLVILLLVFAPLLLAAEPPLSAFERQEIEKLKLQLVDPESLNLRGVFTATLENGASVVCGEMNAKNRSGGYNGFERFIVAGRIVRVASESPETFVELWPMICGN